MMIWAIEIEKDLDFGRDPSNANQCVDRKSNQSTRQSIKELLKMLLFFSS